MSNALLPLIEHWQAHAQEHGNQSVSSDAGRELLYALANMPSDTAARCAAPALVVAQDGDADYKWLRDAPGFDLPMVAGDINSWECWWQDMPPALRARLDGQR